MTLIPQMQNLVEQLIELPEIITKKVYRKAPTQLDYEELYGIAQLALVEAADYYPSYCRKKGHDLADAPTYFRTYAAMRINGALLDYLRRIDWASRSSRAIHKRSGEGSELVRAKAAGVSQGRLRRADRDTDLRPVHIDENERELRSVCGSAEESVFSTDLLLQFAEAVDGLPDRERTIVIFKYYYEWDLRRVSKKLGISEPSTWKLHVRAVEKVLKAVGLHTSAGEACGDLEVVLQGAGEEVA